MCRPLFAQFRLQPSLPYGAVEQHSNTPHHFISALIALQRQFNLTKLSAKMVDIIKMKHEGMLATLDIIVVVITNSRDVLSKTQPKGIFELSRKS